MVLGSDGQWQESDHMTTRYRIKNSLVNQHTTVLTGIRTRWGGTYTLQQTVSPLPVIRHVGRIISNALFS